MLKEFKKFIARGNVLDLAVGVIVGGAFSSIVTSLVNNIFTPIIGLIVGGVDFSSLSITFRDTKIMYGAFIQSVIDFLIVAFRLFIVVKAVYYKEAVDCTIKYVFVSKTALGGRNTENKINGGI